MCALAQCHKPVDPMEGIHKYKQDYRVWMMFGLYWQCLLIQIVLAMFTYTDCIGNVYLHRLYWQCLLTQIVLAMLKLNKYLIEHFSCQNFEILRHYFVDCEFQQLMHYCGMFVTCL